MEKKEMEVAALAAESSRETQSNLLFNRREMLGMAGMAGMGALTSGLIVPEAAAQVAPRRPRIAALVSYWGLPTSHADWVVNKMIDGYWWKGAYVPSAVDVVSVYINQFETSLLGQRVCKAKGIPIYKSVGEAVCLGGRELAVDGVVIVCEHGSYPTDLKGHWLLPRWWIYNQVIQVFERSKRSVPIFNDKHLSYNWDDAKWMYDKSRELDFPLSGGSSIPLYYRTPEVDLEPETPLKNGLVVGDMADEGATSHAIDVLQSFMDRRKGGETGVKSVQSIRNKEEVWKWFGANPWAMNLLEAVRKKFNLPEGHFQQGEMTPGMERAEAAARAAQAANPQAGQANPQPGQANQAANPAGAQAANRQRRQGPPQPRPTNLCIVEYNDGTKAASFSGSGVGWTFAGDIAGKQDPFIVSMLNWPGPISQYHAANAHEHWAIQMMLTRKEQFNAERLLLSTGIVNHYMESNWQNGVYSPVGRVVLTPYMNMTYKSTHGAMFNTGERPPNRPFIRGFATVND